LPPEEETKRILKIYDFDRIPNKIPALELAKWKVVDDPDKTGPASPTVLSPISPTGSSIV